MSWSAAQYVKFEDERTRPVHDLVARIPNAVVAGAADIGCGPGNSTEVLQARYPDAQIVGLDSSPDMIDAARKRLPGIAFAVADIRQWRPEQRFDVILANAVLQWIPGHETLMPALTERLSAGGALAVQMPDNLDEPSHRLMREVAGAGPWARKAYGRRQSARRAPRRRMVLPSAPRPRVPCRCLAHDLPPPARRRPCGRRMGEGHRSSPVHRSAR